jgi:hypothetical protein
VAAEFHRADLCRRLRCYRPGKHPRKGVTGNWEALLVHLMRSNEAQIALLSPAFYLRDRWRRRSLPF